MQLFFKIGDHGKKVEAIQLKLQHRGIYLGKIDGNFGLNTESAVMAFQAMSGLHSDGTVGPKTWAALGLAELQPEGIPAVPHGKQAIIETFGDPLDPGYWEAYAGFCETPSELNHCFTYKKKDGKHGFYCNKLLIPVFQAVYADIVAEGLASELKTFGGCFNIRRIRGGSGLSTHSWAIAVDHNEAENMLGVEPKIDPRIVAIFKRHGFVWGGDFKRRDGMHFQYCTGH